MKKIISFFFSVLFLVCAPAAAWPTTIQQKFAEAQNGDFIVTSQQGNYSLLFIRSLTPTTITLEEISAPTKHVELKKIDWKKWVAAKAPGHTSWTLLEIDRATGKLTQCFSFSKNGWLYLDESEQFLTRLLTLPLSPISQSERRKIGPEPAQGEMDRRSVWNPPLVVNGVKISKPSFEVMKARWPNDGSLMSLCFIELYFAKAEPKFPFPYWLEVQSPHYTFKMRAIDSGHGIVSPMQNPSFRSVK